MLERIRFEILKLFSPLILLFLLLIFLLCLFFVNLGIVEYNKTVNDLEVDLDIELNLADSYLSYEQYGAFGYRILLKPSPLIVFFNNSILINEIEGSISTFEIIKIHFNAKGDEILKKQTSGLRDFGGSIDTFGSLFMLILGVMAFKNREFPFRSEKRVFLHGYLRLLLIDCYFIFLMLSMYLIAMFKHISFSPYDFRQYIIFGLVTIIYLNLWYFKGMLFSLKLKFKSSLLISIIIWALMVIAIPEIRHLFISTKEIKSEKKVSLIKLKTAFNAQKKHLEKVLPLLKDKEKNIGKIKSILRQETKKYLGKEYLENKSLEQDIINSVRKQIDRMENFSCYLPWPFYRQLQESISSKGYDAYNGFVDFVIEMRDGFFRYIIDKRYNSKDKKVIPYIKQGENVYHSRSVLPRGFLRGILSILVFSLLFTGLSILVYWRRQKKENSRESKPLNVIQFNQNKSFFYRCKNKEEIRKYAQYLSTHKDVVLIEKIDLKSYDPGTCLKYWIRYICAVQGIKSGEVMKLLDRLQVSNKELELGAGKIDNELFKKAYLALKLCEKKEYYILIEFFQGESGDFENLCKKLFRELPYRFIYLSPESLKQAGPSGSGNLNILSIDWFDEDLIVR